MSGELGKALAQKLNKEMPREQLEEHIASTLKTVRMCTLVTTKDDIPRATPLEYFSEGLTIYMSPDRGTKTRNIEANPNISISIYNILFPDWENAWEGLWGMQITGKGELLKEGDPGYAHAWEVIDFASYVRALGLKEVPKDSLALRVPPSKIELLDWRLIAKGFHPQQVWQPKD